MSSAGDRLYERLAPVATYDVENGMVVQAIAETLAAPQQIVEDLARDSDTQLAWQAALDPDTCPAIMLPWLAQFAGVTLQPGDDEAGQRARITQAAGFYRGTNRAIRENVQATLTGSKGVTILERVSGNRWATTIVTRASETPDPAATTRAALSQKPTGFIFTVVTSDEPIIDEGGAARTIDAIGSAGTTIDGVTVADWT